MDDGILTKEQENFIKEKLDALIKGNVIVEPISDLALKFLIPFIDDKYGEQLLEKLNVPDEMLLQIRAVIDAAMAEDWEEAAEVTEELLVEHINTPVGDMYERLILNGIFSILLGIINKKPE